jgi:hypothetical protein
MLGRPEDRPYDVYLVPEPSVAQEFPPSRLVGDDATWVAQMEVFLEPYVVGALRFAPHHAEVGFTAPDVPFGRYHLVHCSADCTKTLGDVVGGVLTIGPEPIPPPSAPKPTTITTATTTTPVTTSSPATSTTEVETTAASPDRARSSSDSLPAGGIAAGAVIVVGGLGAAFARRAARGRGPEQDQGTGATRETEDGPRAPEGPGAA